MPRWIPALDGDSAVNPDLVTRLEVRRLGQSVNDNEVWEIHAVSVDGRWTVVALRTSLTSARAVARHGDRLAEVTTPHDLTAAYLDVINADPF